MKRIHVLNPTRKLFTKGMSKKITKLNFDNFESKELALEEFFCASFQYYETPLKTLALRLLKDEVHAQDIIQEVFIDFWEIRHKIEEIDNIEAYLFRMTRNKIIDALRKISSNEKLKDQIWRFMQTENNDNAEKIEAKELQEILTKAIEDLPPKRKQIYLLKNEEGKSYQDIAEKMNISQHTVKNQLSSAVGAIRLFISQQFRDFSVFLISFFFYN